MTEESTSSRRGWRDLSGPLALVPAGLFMFVFFALPAIRLAQVSLYDHEPGAFMRPGFTFEHYRAFLTDPFYLSKIWLTTWIAAVVTVVTLILSLPIAYLLARGRFAGKGLVIGLLLTPLLTNFIVLVFAWIILLGPNGFLAQALHSLLGRPVKLLYAEPGVIIALVHVSIPYAVIPLIAAIAQIREDLEEAAISLGASPWRAFFLVVLPLTTTGIASAAFITVSIVLSGFAFALFVGGDGVLIVPLLIWQQVTRTLNWPLAAAMSLASFAMLLALLILSMAATGLIRQRRARA